VIRTIVKDSALLLGRDRRMARHGPMVPVEILLVEDSPDDAALMVVALREGGLTTRVAVVEDGEQAIDYLRRVGEYAAMPLPHLVLLDLFLPRKNGFEVLAEIKQDPELRRIPVVIMTSSDNERAILGAYDMHANCCVPKPADQAQFAQVVQRIEHFWLNVANRP
jgi:chemotaxis family two-component system response regulator Rcp1